jgi:hypothetical protein
MKKLNYLLLLGFILFLIAGCSKDDYLDPVLDKGDLAVSSLKGAKTEVEFSGVCVPTGIDDVDIMFKPLPNGKALHEFITVWHDYGSDPLVTGQTTWYVKQKIEEDGSFKYWGKCELVLDDGPGVWQMSWRGYLTFTATGPQLIAYGTGQGKSGIVKGLVGKWTYILNFDTFQYEYTGVYH